MSKDVHVFSKNMLDDEHASQFNKEWLAQSPDGTILEFDTEEQACELQRFYRKINKLDELTGEINEL